MKKFISIGVITMTILQCIVLYLFFSNKLSSYPENLVDVIWIVSALLDTIFGIVFFRLSRQIKIPESTVIIIALFGLIGFPFMIFGYWFVVVMLIVLGFGIHFYKHRYSKFTIFPVISAIMGVYSIGLYMLMKGITSM
jgi:hypothetical protein